MPHILKWNKSKTKVKVWSTIVNAYLTKYEDPKDLVNDYKHGDLVLREVYGICPCCKQKLPTPPNHIQEGGKDE